MPSTSCASLRPVPKLPVACTPSIFESRIMVLRNVLLLELASTTPIALQVLSTVPPAF